MRKIVAQLDHNVSRKIEKYFYKNSIMSSSTICEMAQTQKFNSSLEMSYLIFIGKYYFSNISFGESTMAK